MTADKIFTQGRWTFFSQPKRLTVMDDNQKANARRLTGKRIGQVVVIGPAEVCGKVSYNGKGRRMKWIVRCDCGNFEHRNTSAVTNPENNYDRCAPCQTKHSAAWLIRQGAA